MALAICDCHVHVFDPQRFRYATPRRFTPSEATVSQLEEHMRAVGLCRVVLVQPSVYGEDNACLLDALHRLGDAARGVAVVSPGTPQEDIAALDEAGVRGARINLAVDPVETPGLALAKVSGIEACIPAHWHVQLHVSPTVLGTLSTHMAQSGRTYVLDHFGLPDTSPETQAFAWQRQLKLLQTGSLHVKLSAPYLVSRVGSPYPDVEPLAKSLMSLRPDRVLWGSNWPHTQGTSRQGTAKPEEVEVFRAVDDRLWRDACATWAGACADALLARNAEILYGFSARGDSLY
jgi:2-pyrone-4,6-dicarboxylate lactonase